MPRREYEGLVPWCSGSRRWKARFGGQGRLHVDAWRKKRWPGTSETFYRLFAVQQGVRGSAAAQFVVDNAAAAGLWDSPPGFDRSNRSSRHGVNRVVTRCLGRSQGLKRLPNRHRPVRGAGHESVYLRGSQMGIECSRIEVDCRRWWKHLAPGDRGERAR